MEKEIYDISVIVPIYNKQAYISECVNSLLNQTLKNIEIILIDDGSTDASLEICKNIEKIANNIKVYSKSNEGLGLTRNFGIEKANGNFVAFLDADDYVENDFYIKMYNKIIRTDSDACFSNVKYIEFDGSINQYGVIPFKNKIDSKIFLNNLLHVKDEQTYGNSYMGMSAANAIYRMKTIRENNIKFESERKFISEDILFNMEFCIYSKSISFCPEVNYYYRYNDLSLTHIYREDRFEKSKILYKEILRKLKKYNIESKATRGVASIFMGYVRASIRQEIFFSKKEKKEIMKFINVVVNDKTVIQALNLKEKENLKRNIFDYLLKMKLINLIYFSYKITNLRKKGR